MVLILILLSNLPLFDQNYQLVISLKEKSKVTYGPKGKLSNIASRAAKFTSRVFISKGDKIVSTTFLEIKNFT